MEKSGIENVFILLLQNYGPQGWWPLYSRRFTDGYDACGYRMASEKKSSKPFYGRISPNERFEIAVGAVLTQNTAWKNVERALANLESAGLLSGEAVREVSFPVLGEAVRPSGYYNEKAKKLKILAEFLIEERLLEGGNTPSREELLELWGIGKETADSILLYAYNVPVFVVDAYTKRMFKRLGVLYGNEEYDEIANIFVSSLGRNAPLFNEYHALIVRHGKEHCRKKPVCEGCVLKVTTFCRFNDEAAGGEESS